MIETKRLRVFAGPNGSGKSTLFADISNRYSVGYFVNSDIIEEELSKTRYINLEEFGLSLTQKDLTLFLEEKDSLTLLNKAKDAGYPIDLYIKENVIVDKSKNAHSYEASLITSFIRKNLMAKGISFSFETVMSHVSKLNEISYANELGYKTYLYFVCLDDPLLNLSRVNDRTGKGGHHVPVDRVVSRYERSLANLLPAMKIAKKAYLLDNSDDELILVAVMEQGKITKEIEIARRPNWFLEYVVNRL